MASTERRTEFFVGLFLFIGLALLGALIVQFGRFGDRLKDHYTINVIFDDASGLIKGSEVRMGGAKIGKVEAAPELTEAVKVQAVLAIHERVKIPSGSSVQIGSASLLGDKLVVITPPSQPTDIYLQPGQTVMGGGPAGLEAIQSNAEQVTRDVRRLMQASEGTLIKVDAAVDDLRAVTGRLGDTVEKVNTSILSDKNLANIEGTISNFEATTTEWKKASVELQPALAEARDAIRSFHQATANADQTIAEIKPAIQEMPKAVDSIARAADKAGNAIEKAEKGDGLLGTLAYDREVGTDTRTFIRNLRERGILRYRDEAAKEEEDPRNRYRGQRR
jgi:phospholipid/cholesterol/gamma-HCH transport system substrate-binding protein